MGYPNGPLLRALAERVLRNIEIIENVEAKSSDPLSPEGFAATQLLISLLGVLVLLPWAPHTSVQPDRGDRERPILQKEWARLLPYRSGLG